MNLRVRFSLRLFLILFTTVAIFFGGAAHWVYREKEKVRRHKLAVEKLQERDIVFETYSLAEPRLEGESAYRRFVRLNIDHDAYPRIGNVMLNFTAPRQMPIQLNEALGYLSQMQCIEEVSLEDTHLTRETATGLAQLPDLTSLHLSIDSIDPDAAEALRGMRSLQELRVWGHVSGIDYQEHGRIGDEALKAIAALPRLKELSLLGTGLSDAGLSSIGRINTLENLELRQVLVSPGWLEALQGAKRLRSVNLWSAVFQPGSSEALGKLESLTTLEIVSTNPLPEQLLREVVKLPHLEELVISGAPAFDPERIRLLLACAKLRVLKLCQTCISEEELIAFGNHPALTDFAFVGDLPRESIKRFLLMKKKRCVRQLSGPNLGKGYFYAMDGDKLYEHELGGPFGVF